MSCLTKQALIEDIAKKLIPELRISFPEAGGPELKRRSLEAATIIQAAAEDLAMQDIFDLEATTKAIKANASTATPLPKEKQIFVTVSKEVMELDQYVTANPSNAGLRKLHNLEMAQGLRNADGESLVRRRPYTPIMGSASVFEGMSSDQFEDYYINDDGTMKKSANVNNALIELDKINNEENFDEEHSAHLTSMLTMFTNAVSSLDTNTLKLKKSTLQNVIEAEGSFSPDTGTVELHLDTHGPGAAFRNKFSMTNQEVYVHELTHAALDYIWKKTHTDVANNADIIAFTASVQELYEKARKETTWESLLPGFKEGTQYTSTEKAQAVAKWDYIFKNEDGYGLHEFAAGILTNANFREAMNKVGALSTVKADKNETMVTKIRRVFNNILEKLLGFATSKRDNTITLEATALLTKIFRANNNAVETVSKYQVINTISDAMDVVQEKLDAGNDLTSKLITPFIGVFDAIEETIGAKGDKALPEDILKEFVALKTKLDKITEGINDEAYQGNKFVGYIHQTFKLMNALQKFIRAMPSIYKMRTLVKDNKRHKQIVAHYARSINKLLESVHLAQDGILRSFIREFMDRPGMYNFLADAILKLTHSVDGVREATFVGVKADIKEFFGDVKIDNNRLNSEHNEALTTVVLRTDIQSLGLTSEELEELLRDPSNVDKKIAELSKGLTPEQLSDVSSLAYHMVKGTPTSNAYQIARGFGREYNPGNIDDLISQIDKLVSYKALALTDADSKDSLYKFLSGESYVDYSNTLTNKLKKSIGFENKLTMSKEEYNAKVHEGVTGFLSLATGLHAASKEEMKNNPNRVIKGYIKETYNKDVSLEMLPMSSMDKALKEGYTFVRELAPIPGTAQQYGMFINTIPALKRANGALGLQDNKSRGFSLKDMISREAEEDKTQWDNLKKYNAFNALLNDVREQYLKDRKSVSMQPVFDDNGTIVDFRATMSLQEKKDLLDIELRGDINLARSYSTMGMSTATAKHNRTVIDMLYKDYNEGYNADSAEEYAVIQAPNQLDASDYGLPKKVLTKEEEKYAKFWARLPGDTKKYATEKFGDNKIVIRKELLIIAFGDDNFSVSKLELLNNISPKNKALLAKGESIWQDIMTIAKGNIVIKLPEVIAGNNMSNFKMLVYLGVSPLKGAKLLLTGIRELHRYEQDKKELAKLKRAKLVGNGDAGRMVELEKRLSTNSVTPLLEAGLFQSIVEDVEATEEGNKVAQWFEDKTDKYVPNETANTALHYMFMTKRTKPYQQLLKLTQVSDFYFRYVQYYDSVDKGNEKYAKSMIPANHKFTKEELLTEIERIKGNIPEAIATKIKTKAMRDAIDNYINYEAPLEKHVRYGDAMGAWFFVKYFIRIQKVIKKVAKENPLRMGTDIAFQTFITGDTSDIQEASFFNKGLSSFNPSAMFGRLWEFVSPAGVDFADQVFERIR